MLVIVINDHILPPHTICQACPLADHDGEPRWRPGKLCCGQLLRNLNCCNEPQPNTYQCQMGFRLVEIS